MSFVRRLLALSGVAVFFVACGDDKGSSILDELMLADYVVDDADGLKDCNDDREGMTAYLKGDDSLLVCLDGEWVAYDSTLSSSSKARSSSSEDWDSSDDREESSSSEQDVVIEDKSISGKCLFVSGSTVSVMEVDGETLEQTGRVYKVIIANDSGTYEMSGLTFESEYAIVEVSGYYRLGASGETTKIPVALKALINVSGDGAANVNLLSHLEYSRVLGLVASGKDVAKAKKQARSEILDAFGFDVSVGNFEELDEASYGDGSAVLLAADVIMQGGLNDTQLLLRLMNFARDIENDGEWNDSVAKTEMADWAMQMDLNGRLALVRENIDAWKLGKIANFEKYVRVFWAGALGLGECSAKNEGEKAEIANKLSMYYGLEKSFVCSEGDWTEAVVSDVDGWEAGTDGETRYSMSGDYYKYDESLGKWVEATPREYTLGIGGCTKNRNGAVVKSPSDNSYYKCSEIGWRVATKLDFDTDGHDCESSDDEGVVIQGNSLDSDYYVCRDDGWQAAVEIVYDTYGLECASEDVGGIAYGVVTKNKRYYCSDSGWMSLDDWSWNIPKDVRFSPNISYGSLKDTRDGQEYRTIIIGSYEWMAENMNYKTSYGSFCYEEKDANCKVSGRLYNWDVADDYACPEGWYLPWNSNYEDLITSLGGRENAARVLRSTSGWGVDNKGIDSIGFNVLPAGYRYGDYYGGSISYEMAGYATRFWTSNSYNSYSDYVFLVYVDNVYISYVNGNYGASYVRCIRAVSE